jgi:hypothetical protein
MPIITREKNGPNLLRTEVPNSNGTSRLVTVPKTIGKESATRRILV